MRLLTIALALACGAAISSAGSAFAASEGNETYYPQDFDRTLAFDSPLKDYAIYNNTYAFANGTSVFVISDDDNGERSLTPYAHTSEIAALDYDENGDLYFKDIMSGVYFYSGSKPTVCEDGHEFQKLTRSRIELTEEVFYTLNNEGVLTYWNEGNDSEVGEGFSIMKQFGGVIYAVKDNVPHKIDGSAAEPIGLSYTDFNGADNIYSGETWDKLKTFNGEVVTAQIKDGAYYTQIDAEKSGEKFSSVRTQKATGNTPCLVLCESGNASLVSIGGDLYITAKDNLVETAECRSNTDGKTYYAIEEVGVYTAPFMSGCTRTATLKSGAAHKVTVLEKFVHTVLGAEFCKISFTEDGESVTGYVAANFLTPYDFSAEDNKPTTGGDVDGDYGTNTTTVLLVVLIIGLVIIAVLYIVLVGFKRDKTSGKNKKKKRRPEPEDFDDDEEDDEQ